MSKGQHNPQQNPQLLMKWLSEREVENIHDFIGWIIESNQLVKNGQYDQSFRELLLRNANAGLLGARDHFIRLINAEIATKNPKRITEILIALGKTGFHAEDLPGLNITAAIQVAENGLTLSHLAALANALLVMRFWGNDGLRRLLTGSEDAIVAMATTSSPSPQLRTSLSEILRANAAAELPIHGENLALLLEKHNELPRPVQSMSELQRNVVQGLIRVGLASVIKSEGEAVYDPKLQNPIFPGDITVLGPDGRVLWVIEVDGGIHKTRGADGVTRKTDKTLIRDEIYALHGIKQITLEPFLINNHPDFQEFLKLMQQQQFDEAKQFVEWKQKEKFQAEIDIRNEHRLKEKEQQNKLLHTAREADYQRAIDSLNQVNGVVAELANLAQRKNSASKHKDKERLKKEIAEKTEALDGLVRQSFELYPTLHFSNHDQLFELAIELQVFDPNQARKITARLAPESLAQSYLNEARKAGDRQLKEKFYQESLNALSNQQNQNEDLFLEANLGLAELYQGQELEKTHLTRIIESGISNYYAAHHLARIYQQEAASKVGSERAEALSLALYFLELCEGVSGAEEKYRADIEQEIWDIQIEELRRKKASNHKKSPPSAHHKKGSESKDEDEKDDGLQKKPQAARQRQLLNQQQITPEEVDRRLKENPQDQSPKGHYFQGLRSLRAENHEGAKQSFESAIKSSEGQHLRAAAAQKTLSLLEQTARDSAEIRRQWLEEEKAKKRKPHGKSQPEQKRKKKDHKLEGQNHQPAIDNFLELMKSLFQENNQPWPHTDFLSPDTLAAIHAFGTDLLKLGSQDIEWLSILDENLGRLEFLIECRLSENEELQLPPGFPEQMQRTNAILTEKWLQLGQEPANKREVGFDEKTKERAHQCLAKATDYWEKLPEDGQPKKLADGIAFAYLFLLRAKLNEPKPDKDNQEFWDEELSHFFWQFKRANGGKPFTGDGELDKKIARVFLNLAQSAIESFKAATEEWEKEEFTNQAFTCLQNAETLNSRFGHNLSEAQRKTLKPLGEFLLSEYQDQKTQQSLSKAKNFFSWINDPLGLLKLRLSQSESLSPSQENITQVSGLVRLVSSRLVEPWITQLHNFALSAIESAAPTQEKNRLIQGCAHILPPTLSQELDEQLQKIKPLEANKTGQPRTIPSKKPKTKKTEFDWLQVKMPDDIFVRYDGNLRLLLLERNLTRFKEACYWQQNQEPEGVKAALSDLAVNSTILNGGLTGQCDWTLVYFLEMPLEPLPIAIVTAALLSTKIKDPRIPKRSYLETLLLNSPNNFCVSPSEEQTLWDELGLVLVLGKRAELMKERGEIKQATSDIFLALGLLTKLTHRNPGEVWFLSQELKTTFSGLEAKSRLLLANGNEVAKTIQERFKCIEETIKEIRDENRASWQRSEEAKSKESNEKETNDLPLAIIQPTKTTKPAPNEQLTQSYTPG